MKTKDSKALERSGIGLYDVEKAGQRSQVALV